MFNKICKDIIKHKRIVEFKKRYDTLKLSKIVTVKRCVGKKRKSEEKQYFQATLKSLSGKFLNNRGALLSKLEPTVFLYCYSVFYSVYGENSLQM